MNLEPVCSVGVCQRPSNNQNWCIICQKPTKTVLSTATQNGIDRFKESFEIRKKNNDVTWGNLFQRIWSLDDIQHNTILWHKACYASFTSRQNLQKFQKETVKQGIQQPEVLQPQSSVEERTLRSKISLNMNKCILCQKRKKTDTQEEKLLLVQSLNIAEKIQKIALENSAIHCRLGELDPIAAEILYHRSCLKKLSSKQVSDTTERDSLFDEAFKKLCEKMDEGFIEGHVYALTTLSHTFNDILFSMGMENPKYSRTLLLNRIIKHYGGSIDVSSSDCRRETTLIFPKISAANAIQQLQNVCQERIENGTSQSTIEELGDDQFMTRILYHVAQKIKSDLKSVTGLSNVIELTTESAKATVPESLQMFLKLILSDNNDNLDNVDKKVISLGQDIVYACNKRVLTPKHIGIGLAIHQATRSRSLVEMLHAAGNSVSYQTLLRIDTSIANHILKEFQEKGMVYIPENLCHSKDGYHFVQFAADNIDILEETIDGRGTFHATQIVAFQRGPAKKIDSIVPLERASALHDIPYELSKVDAVPAINKPEVKIPAPVNVASFAEHQEKNPINNRDIIWLTCRSSAHENQVIPSWTDMNKVVTQESHQMTTVGYTPILNHPAHETDTLVAVLNRCKEITNALGQPRTVVTCDEALYCKIKQIQWCSDHYNDVVARLGGFHWVLNYLRVIGQHFGNSGLSDIWVETNIYGENTAQSIMDGRHYNRAIRALKLTTDALWRVLFQKIMDWAREKGAYPEDVLTQIQSLGNCNVPDLELISKWNALETKADIIYDLLKEFDKQNETNQLYLFWRSYLDMAGLVLKFIRAEREGNWSLHLETVAQMIPWFFVYDHTNYARWGMVYFTDMQALPEIANDVYVQFMNGNFVVKETTNAFNGKSPDQALEHINKIHKVAGGVIGITRNDTARDRWCLTFNYRSHLTEMARKLFGVQHNETCEKTFTTNLKKDEADVQKLVNAFNKRKVFDDTNRKLSNIVTGEIASNEIASDLLSAKSRGHKLAEDFLTNRLIEKQIDFYSPLKKIKSKTFKHLHTSELVGKGGKKVGSGVDTNVLVRQMFSAVKSGRSIDLKNIMKNELRDPPPSLFDANGLIRNTPKAALCNILADKCTFETLPNEGNVKTATIIDGQALVQSIGKPKEAKTFGDLSEVFIASVVSNFKTYNCQSVHVVFDRYDTTSIKSHTREKRKKCVVPIEHHITGRDTLLPSKWDKFIHSTENKARLSNFLSMEIATKASHLPNTQELLTSGGYFDAKQVSTNIDRDIDHLRSTQEEADTRIILHGIDCKQLDFERLIVNCRDTDVLLLLIHHYENLPKDVWMKAGTKKHPKYIAVKNIQESMPYEKRKSLLAYHSLTGCDTTSALSGHTKKSSWLTYQNNFQLLTNVGVSLEVSEDDFLKAEKFAVLIYTNKKSSGLQVSENLNELRASMFQNVKELDKLPPTTQTFRLHVQRANYQAFCWRNADIAQPILPVPTDSGWKMTEAGVLAPVFSLNASISLRDLEFISCQCKTGCRSSRCSCSNKKQKCMEDVCHVGLKCFNQYNYGCDGEQNDENV